MKKVLSILSIALVAFDASALTLTEALVSAYNNNQELISKREELKAHDEEMSKAISSFLPDIKFTFSKNNQKDNRFANYDGTSIDSSGWARQKSKTNTLNYQQNLFAGGRSLMALQAAKYQINVYRADLHRTEQKVLLETIDALNYVTHAQEVIAVNKNNVDALSTYLEATKQRFDAGLATKSEVARSEADLEAAKSQLIAASGNYVESLAHLKQQIGIEPENPQAVSLPEALPKHIDEVISLSQKQNPQIVMAKNSELRAGLTVNAAISAMLPTLDLGASVSSSKAKTNRTSGLYPNDQGGFSFEDKPTRFTDSARRKDITVGLTLTVPIYNKGLEYSAIRESRSNLSKAKADYRKTLDELNSNSTQAWIRHETNLASLQAQQKADESFKVALDGILNEYKEGVKSLEELLVVKSNHFTNQIKLLNAKRQITLSAYQLKAITGKLTAKDLGLPTKLYDPNVHYHSSMVKLIGF